MGPSNKLTKLRMKHRRVDTSSDEVTNPVIKRIGGEIHMKPNIREKGYTSDMVFMVEMKSLSVFFMPKHPWGYSALFAPLGKALLVTTGANEREGTTMYPGHQYEITYSPFKAYESFAVRNADGETSMLMFIKCADEDGKMHMQYFKPDSYFTTHRVEHQITGDVYGTDPDDLWISTTISVTADQILEDEAVQSWTSLRHDTYQANDENELYYTVNSNGDRVKIRCAPWDLPLSVQTLPFPNDIYGILYLNALVLGSHNCLFLVLLPKILKFFTKLPTSTKVQLAKIDIAKKWVNIVTTPREGPAGPTEEGLIIRACRITLKSGELLQDKLSQLVDDTSTASVAQKYHQALAKRLKIFTKACFPPVHFLRVCELCHKQDQGLKKCARCKKTYYCSEEHQREHWKVHKLECK